jgi:hypothetical protein
MIVCLDVQAAKQRDGGEGQKPSTQQSHHACAAGKHGAATRGEHSTTFVTASSSSSSSSGKGGCRADTQRPCTAGPFPLFCFSAHAARSSLTWPLKQSNNNANLKLSKCYFQALRHTHTGGGRFAPGRRCSFCIMKTRSRSCCKIMATLQIRGLEHRGLGVRKRSAVPPGLTAKWKMAVRNAMRCGATAMR